MKTNYGSIVRVGVDLAKSVMQVHAIDADERVVVTKQLARGAFAAWCARLPPGCIVAMEASVGCHHWARELEAMGLVVRLMSPSLVTPYRNEGPGGKNDANDAAAICEAASRPKMRFVPAKSPEQQGWLAVHRLRQGFIEERTATINRIKGILLEFGIANLAHPNRVSVELADILTDPGSGLPQVAREVLDRCRRHLGVTAEHIDWCNAQILNHTTQDIVAIRAMSVIGVGPLSASALSATVGDFSQFRNGRQFSAWIGLVPSQRSSGKVRRLGRITRRGDVYLRTLLVLGARSALITAAKREDSVSKWATQLKERVGWSKATVALANKNARLVWKTLTQAQ